MSRKRLIQFGVFFAVAAYLWVRAISRDGAAHVFNYAIAGTLAGVALAWITWSFALVPFRRKTLEASLLAGFAVVTPLTAMLLTPSSTPLDSSAVVLATTAACLAAIAGAIWGIVHLAREAYSLWRDDRSTTRPVSMQGAHR